MHALHATLSGLRVRAWFGYVASKANVSDEPSREIRQEWERLCLPGGAMSDPVPLAMPEARSS